MNKSSLLALILMLSLAGCSLFGVGKDDCEGRVELSEQNIEVLFPDTLILALREEHYLIDIDAPPLFRHTAGKRVSLNADTREDEVVFVSAGNYPTARLDIYTRSIGKAEVFVSGFDRCLGSGPTFSFVVNVVDTAATTAHKSHNSK